MEEDIKVLKEFVNQYNTDEDLFCFVNYSTIQAIENLINRNKVLEELVKSNEIYVIDTIEDLEKLNKLDVIAIRGKEYISKSKVREKIKEYQNRNLHFVGITDLEELLQEGDDK